MIHIHTASHAFFTDVQSLARNSFFNKKEELIPKWKGKF